MFLAVWLKMFLFLKFFLRFARRALKIQVSKTATVQDHQLDYPLYPRLTEVPVPKTFPYLLHRFNNVVQNVSEISEALTVGLLKPLGVLRTVYTNMPAPIRVTESNPDENTISVETETKSFSTGKYSATIDEFPPIPRRPLSSPATLNTFRLHKKRAAFVGDYMAKAQANGKEKVSKRANRFPRFVILAVILIRRFTIILIQSIMRTL